MSRRAAILAGLDNIPSLPTAACRTMQLLSDPGSGAKDIAAAVRVDPGLTADVLRLANTALFRGTNPVTSLKEAVVRLGIGRVARLAAALGLAPLARREIRGYGLPAGALLMQSVTAGLIAETLGRRLAPGACGPAYTAALLCLVGKIVLGTFLEIDADPILRLCQESDLPFHLAEREVLGIDHAEAGAELLARWGLPETIVGAVRHSLSPEEAQSPGPVLDLVHCGRTAATMIGLFCGLDGLRYAPSPAVSARLGLTPLILEAALAEAVDEALNLCESPSLVR